MISAPTVSMPVFGLTLRSLLGGKKALALGLLATLPVIAALVFAAAGDLAPELFWARLVQRLLLPTVTAFVAVVIGASAIGDEREDGTILYLAATPLPRAGLVLTKVMASWTASMALLVPSALISGIVALGSDASASLLLWPLVAVALSAFCYCAAAAWLSLAIRRPVVIGVLYILLWEGSIATFAASADRFSIAAYGRAIAVEGVIDVNAPGVSAVVAVIVLGIVSAVAIWAAARRMVRTELP